MSQNSRSGDVLQAIRCWLVLLIAMAALTAACGEKRPVLRVPDVTATIPDAGEYVVQGDAHFSKMHLYGWRQAESFYECAFEIQEERSTLDQLILTRFLRLIRESDEGIFSGSYLTDLNFICQNGKGPFQLTLCEIARNRLLLAGLLDEAPLLELSPDVSRSLLEERKTNSALDGYLYLLFLRDMVPYRLPDEFQLFQKEFPDSPLTVYLRAAWGKEGPLLTETADDEFAELSMHAGEQLIGREEYQEGIASLARVVELVPDYVSASIAVGDLFLFTFEYPGAALPYYEAALKWDPRNVRACFGRGVSLHYLGDYVESQSSLDRLLDERWSRWKTVDRDSRPYFRGQASYFKAYNYYLTGQKVEARRWVEEARSLQPEADGPYYLSGVLHFENEAMAESKRDFLQVIVEGTSLCDAYFRLGKIEYRKNSRSALYHFIDNGNCLERNLAVFRDRLEKARKMSLDPGVKEEVKELFKKDLKKRQNDAIASVVSMINLAKSMETIDTTPFLDSMEERLIRISTVTDSELP